MSYETAQTPRSVAHDGRPKEYTFKIASSAAEFEAIHRLNHATFAEEIPQHARQSDQRLVDRFHDENTYAICLCGGALAGMVAGRCSRPFSLDQKLVNLNSHLPPHRKAVEIRLLAVVPAYRKSRVFVGLLRLLARHFLQEHCDLAVISGTLRQLRLYQHLGFRPFAGPVGRSDALYQPMYLTLEALRQRPRLLPEAVATARCAGGRDVPRPKQQRRRDACACDRSSTNP